VASTGRRPTNSGIRPHFNRSSGSTSRKISSVLQSSGPDTLAPKPIEVARPRAEMIFSRPEKAPPQMKYRCCQPAGTPAGDACDRPAGVPRRRSATVPSMILRRACCTPSPGTSRVIEGLLSDLRLILSISRYRRCRAEPDRHCSRLQELLDDVLDVLADIARLRERRGVRHGEGHVQNARQCLGERRLARTSLADQQDVRLRKFNIVVLGLVQPNGGVERVELLFDA
jgi:hypothetical protein